jgi:hypothetical protein
VELIKRSNEIMRLLASDEKYFSTELVEMLWLCCSEKHEDIVRATLDLVRDLAVCMPLEKLSIFSAKLKAMKESDFDEKFVTFLKNYTLNTMKNIEKIRSASTKQSIVGKIISSKPKEGIKLDEAKYIDLGIFWKIFQDQNKVSQKVKDLSLNCLVELLSQFNDADLKVFFINKALENLQKGETFYSSLVFLGKVLNTFMLESQVKYKQSTP